MPTYEYACRDCGEHLEVVQSFRDEPLTVCPNCNGSLRKVFSAAGIVFKGSGWHIKDYAASRSGSSESSKDGGGAGTAADTTSSSDSATSTNDTSSKPTPSKAATEKKSA